MLNVSYWLNVFDELNVFCRLNSFGNFNFIHSLMVTYPFLLNTFLSYIDFSVLSFATFEQP